MKKIQVIIRKTSLYKEVKQSKSLNLPKSDQVDSLFSLTEDTAYSDQIPMPYTTPSINTTTKVLEDCIREMVGKEETFLGQSVRQFVSCTMESIVKDPKILLRNMRQFMTGLKIYLVNTGDNSIN